jgi:hypothetical protein
LGLNCLGYHGTSEEGARKIESEGYEASVDKEWLGKGIYFFCTVPEVVDGLAEAKAWVVYVKKFDRWVVFEAKITSENFLDLVQNVDHRVRFDEVRRQLLDQHLRTGKVRQAFQDYIIFRYIDDKMKFDVIRAFVDAAPKEYFSNVVRRPQVQMCVKRTACIIQNRIVEEGPRRGSR